MNEGSEIPVFSAVLTATLLVVGAAITLIGSIGLLRLRSFYERVHAPTLGTTLGTACVALASMIYFVLQCFAMTTKTNAILHTERKASLDDCRSASTICATGTRWTG
jgi:multisubunit Na+/H+ antiporter MnhG subunit